MNLIPTLDINNFLSKTKKNTSRKIKTFFCFHLWSDFDSD